MRSAKRITVPALIAWTAIVACFIGWHFAVMKFPVLTKRPLTDILVLAMVVGAVSVQSLMRPAPITDVLPSRANSPFVNVVYTANLVIGLMGILSGLYLLGLLGTDKPMVTGFAIANLVASVLVQGVVVAIPIRSSQN